MDHDSDSRYSVDRCGGGDLNERDCIMTLRQNIIMDLNKQLDLVQNTRLTKRQELRASTLDRQDFIRYLKSLKGSRVNIWGINKFSKPKNNLKANRYAEMFDRLVQPEMSHKPFEKSKSRWFGVEIECLFPCDELEVYDEETDEYIQNEDAERDAENSIRQYIIKNKIKRVNFKGDGSIKPDSKDYMGIEFNVLCTEDDNFSNLRKLLSWLNEVGAKVNKSCGLHVHLDQRNYSNIEKSLHFNNLTRCVKALAEIVPESRKNNSYCTLQGSMTNRYSAINGCAIKKYNTIEIRLHSSTIDETKIINWIKLLKLVHDAPKKSILSSVNTLEDLFMVVDVPESLIEYCVMRRDKFMGKSEVQESTSDVILGQQAA